jgi:hypothetical protein
LAQFGVGARDQGDIGAHPSGFVAIEVGQLGRLFHVLGGVLRTAVLEGRGLLGDQVGQAFGQDDQLVDAIVGSGCGEGHGYFNPWSLSISR